MLERIPADLREAYLVAAFFVVPVVGFALSGGQRPPPFVARGLLWLAVAHHTVFLLLSVLRGPTDDGNPN